MRSDEYDGVRDELAAALTKVRWGRKLATGPRRKRCRENARANA